LDQCWISIYDKNLKTKTKFDEGVFHVKWTQILAEVAEEKGCSIVGVVPHYGKPINGTTLRLFKVKPEIVEKDQLNKYKKAGIKKFGANPLQAKRVYVGKKMLSAGAKQSDFAFLAADTHKDEFWEALQEVLAASDSDKE